MGRVVTPGGADEGAWLIEGPCGRALCAVSIGRYVTKVWGVGRAHVTDLKARLLLLSDRLAPSTATVEASIGAPAVNVVYCCRRHPVAA